MELDITKSYQSFDLASSLKSGLYKKVNEQVRGRGKFVIFLIGVGTGIASGVLTVSRRIALIFECIIKGLINVFGASRIKNGSCLRGMKQFFLIAPLQFIVLPFSALSSCFGFVSKPFNLVKSPLNYSEKLWFKHDRNEKQARIDAQKAADYHQVLLKVQQYPTKIDSLKKLGSYYLKGYGVTADRNEAIKYYRMAAELHDMPAMQILNELLDASPGGLS